MENNSWYLKERGVELLIDSGYPLEIHTCGVSIDIETDEKDNFVGLALSNGVKVWYYTKLNDEVSLVLKHGKFIGHNLKGDLKWLRKWGVNVDKKSLSYDTMIASYVVNPTADSHGLKALAQNVLNLCWPTYGELVGKGRTKKTLDKHPIEVVSNYCGMDSLVTYKLYEHFNRIFTPSQKRIFEKIEMPINRWLYEMEINGIKISLDKLEELDTSFFGKLQDVLKRIKKLTSVEIERICIQNSLQSLKEKWEQSAYKIFEKSKEFNPASSQQKRFILNHIGIPVESTGKGILIKYKGNELVDLLLEHSEISKLYSAFIKSFKSIDTLPYVYTTYSQVRDNGYDSDAKGMTTGRLSSKKPNLQQIPSRSEDGKKLRQMFIPNDGHRLIVADYSQIEYRLAAHFSQDPLLCRAFNNGEDLHEATAKALNIERHAGKQCNFCLLFGGWWTKLQAVLGISSQQAEDYYNRYWNTLQSLLWWKRRVINEARKTGGVSTLLGRWIPIQGLNEVNFARKGFAERQAISCKVQGSAADIMKLSLLRCAELGYVPCLTVHDELVFNITQSNIEKAQTVIKQTMESVVKLKVPLPAEIGIGDTWGDAKQ